MQRQILRDKYQKRIGEIITRSDGKLEIRDSFQKKLGEYDPKTNTTRDNFQRVMGTGNLLTTLLSKS